MPKPIIWVLVADASRARVFQLEQPQQTLTPALGQELIGTNLPSREIASDRPGRTFDSGGQGRHGKEPRPIRRATPRASSRATSCVSWTRKRGIGRSSG
jgi:Protein required for attachment to host cells